ncbi:hypothetical protein A9G08_05430 [Gilliamella sp. wkB195]|uniref:hypothetical protein n=1 Tax=Gilliamella sp. wkB195 TaxID=3120261 RepID=UPI00080E5DD2|nr:hypothetical protein [Gilliamella apicola]OCF99528.1 hypothetical protein A9G08_05430 [Gilliamella apicola]
MAFFFPFSSHALTSQTTKNHIQGSAPYLTFDGGRTRAINTDSLLGITLSNGTKYTPSTNNSSTTPIQLPVTGQSFADIGMLVPTNTNSVALSTLIGSPYNYWGDDDGDTNVTATGTLSLSIVDKNNEPVSRNTVLTICKAPYQVKLTSTNGTLTTRYGVPRSRNFNASNATYYINPKASAVVCFARPDMDYSTRQYAGPAEIWDSRNGFLTQSTRSSSYYQNFPTTGAHGLYFDLDIGGSNQTLSWAPVSRGGITATMSYSTSNRVRVTLTGPVATQSQRNSSNPGRISKPSLPQTFELIGRDSNGNAIVKYGFRLKQWFVNRGNKQDGHSNTSYWCSSIGYRLSRVRDLTNAVDADVVIPSATPSSSGNHYQRRISAGFLTEWGSVDHYYSADFRSGWYWTSDLNVRTPFIVEAYNGHVVWSHGFQYGLCAYP